jgi:glycosyltransferase involved in cell wall biosynthesis
LRVLFIVDSLGAGGAERSLQELLPAFIEKGVQPVVACFHRRPEGVEQLVAQSHDLRFLPQGPRSVQMLALRRIARQERVVLAHTSLFEADAFGRAALAGSGIPLVTSLVNMPYEAERLRYDPNVNRFKLAAVRGIEIATGLLAAHFHAITHAVKEAAQRRLLIPAHKVTVVYRGRDEQRLGRRSPERRRRVRRALGIPDDAWVILNAARQEFQKGQRGLLEAFSKVSRPGKLLLIAGRRGNASSQLEAGVAELKLGPAVRFLGHRDDVPDLMAAADVFVLPSLWEGLGCVVLEAMALELPIVASDLAPVREIVANESSALLSTPGDSSALIRALDRVSGDIGLAAALAGRARSSFEQRFTLEHSAQGMLALFERVVSVQRSSNAA